ncbi:MAG TPA: hypothetical protein VE783_03970 [Candidatus Limnocylindrales bacterium]|jgi:DNA-binding response OmpR family regulator|nr:hypothetical protein [Candidatus Limnocylindrales bacterium]
MNVLPMRGIKILHVGADPELLWLRTAVLRKHWQVRSVHFQDAERALQHSLYDLVLICHSVPPESRDEIEHLIAESAFPSAVIILRQDLPEDQVVRTALGLQVSSGPDTLVARIDRVMRKAG